MSADRQRLKRSIQRLAETSPGIRKLLDEHQNRGGKPRSAGVGGGAGSEEGSNTSQETSICCDGSVGDPNPGVDERDPTGGDQDGLDPNGPPNLSTLDGGCLTGVTNCDTGESICFCGDGFIPPDGWDDPSDPPVASDYQAGYYWEANSQFPASTPTSSCKQYIEELSSNPYEDTVYVNDSTYDCISRLSPNTTLVEATARRRSCQENNESYCTQTPTEDAWPSDGCTNIAIKGGKIVGSKYDPENDGSYSAPRTEIHICDGADSMYLAPSGSEPGGYKTINSTRTEGYLYNSRHEQIAHIDGSEYSDPAM